MVEQRPLNAERPLGALSDDQVDYVLFDGVAIQAYGHVRTTVDLDRRRVDAGALAAARCCLRDPGPGLGGVEAHLLRIDLTDRDRRMRAGGF